MRTHLMRTAGAGGSGGQQEAAIQTPPRGLDALNDAPSAPSAAGCTGAGVVVMMGSTYNGQYEPVEEVDRALEDKGKGKGGEEPPQA